MKKFHFIYKTICIPTGLIYVGSHSTNKIEDGYIGGGLYFALAYKFVKAKRF